MDKPKHINLVKLCVGAEAVEDLLAWQESPRAHGPDGLPRHVTRMWPKRAEELLDGGSLYWVFKGLILARQRVVRLDEVPGGDPVTISGVAKKSDLSMPFVGGDVRQAGKARAVFFPL